MKGVLFLCSTLVFLVKVLLLSKLCERLICLRHRLINELTFILNCVKLKLMRVPLTIDSFFYITVALGILNQSVFVKKSFCFTILSHVRMYSQ